ncbi:MAG: hypothetical protein ACPG4U_13120 [Pseudomonadales bacterium]
MYQHCPQLQTFDPAINNLRQKIRHGSEADNPSLIAMWLSMEELEFARHRGLRWALYCAQFRLLLDAFADDLVASHWRALCLDNIYRPLCSLQRQAFCEGRKAHIMRLQYELRITSQYFSYVQH